MPKRKPFQDQSLNQTNDHNDTTACNSCKKLKEANNNLSIKNKELVNDNIEKTRRYEVLRKEYDTVIQRLFNLNMRYNRVSNLKQELVKRMALIVTPLADVTQLLTSSPPEDENTLPISENSSPNGNLNNVRTVRPMFQGHVISKPVINLPRMSTEQLVQMNDSVTLEPDSENDVSTITEQAAEGEVNCSTENINEQCPEASYDRLRTITEEEENLASTCHTSILSRYNDIVVNRRHSANSQSRLDLSNSQQTVYTSGSDDCDTKISVEHDETMRNDSTTCHFSESGYQETLENTRIGQILDSIEDSDPLEGPSTLMESVSNPPESTMSFIASAPAPNSMKTSTPFRCGSKANKENTLDEGKFVVQRRKHGYTVSEYKKMSHCRVSLERLPLMVMHTQNNLPSSLSSSSQNSMSSSSGRTSRTKKQVNYKELHINRKERR